MPTLHVVPLHAGCMSPPQAQTGPLPPATHWRCWPHVVPPQQSWFCCPHGVHFEAEQVRFAPQAGPEGQHASPEAPHGVQLPNLQM